MMAIRISGPSFLIISAFFGPGTAWRAQIRSPIVQVRATLRNQFPQVRKVELIPIHTAELHRSLTILKKPDFENQITA
jgi:hypothetical protein